MTEHACACEVAATERRAFTLIELLVVMAIVSLLIALLLPSLARAKFAAYRIQCAANQRQMLLGMNLYAGDSSGYIARRDYGRYDAQYRWRQGSIGTRRPLGPTTSAAHEGPSPVHRGIYHHGSWLVNAYLSTADVMYCPGVTLDEPRSAGFADLDGWKQVMRDRLPYFQSGGTVEPKAQEIMTTSYNFNKNIVFPAAPKNGANSAFWKGAGSGYHGYENPDGWRIDAMQSWFPIFIDVRGNTETVWVAHHASEGYNVAYADGSVRWMNSQTLIAGGQQVLGGSIKDDFIRYSQQALPADPRDDSNVLGISEPYLGNYGRHLLDVPFQAIVHANR